MRVCGTTILNNVIFDNRLFVPQLNLFNDSCNFINSLQSLALIVSVNYSEQVNFLLDTLPTNKYLLFPSNI